MRFSKFVFLLMFVSLLGCSDTTPSHPPSSPAPQDFTPAVIEIGPIPGITTAWHPLPEGPLTLPAQTNIPLRVACTPESEVVWTGAKPKLRDEAWSYAHCRLARNGEVMVVGTRITTPRQQKPKAMQCTVLGVPIEVSSLAPRNASASRIAIEPRAYTNRETYDMFRAPSVASLRLNGEGTYVTSVNAQMVLSAETHPKLGWLNEWRVNDQAIGIGATLSHAFSTVGTHKVTVGPIDLEKTLSFDIYETVITSHISDSEIVPENTLVTFRADTYPPGHEEDVVWVSSTTAGTAAPTLGKGPEFSVTFDKTWNSNDEQWLGVRADNAVFNQDQKAASKLAIWINAFIPRDVAGLTLTVPAGVHAGKTMIPGPFLFSDCFLTDQRSFDNNPAASVRMQSLATLRVKNPGLCLHNRRTSGTVELDCEDGDVECTMNADVTDLLLTGLLTSNTGGVALSQFTFDGAANDPCFAGSPDIDWDVDVTVTCSGGSIVITAQGLVDPFPAFEMYASYKGVTKTLFLRGPSPGQDPWNLPGEPDETVFGTQSFAFP